MSQALVVPAAVYDEFLVRDVAGEQMVIGMGPGYESPHVGFGH